MPDAAAERPTAQAELDRAARSVGALLQAVSARGQPVVLAFEPGRAFVEAFFGCAYVGAVPVPVHCPLASVFSPAARAIAVDCGAKLALCDSVSLPETKLLAAGPVLQNLSPAVTCRRGCPPKCLARD